MAIIDRRGVSVSATDTPIAGDPNPGLAIKAPCLVATTGNIVLSGVQTIDALSVGNNNERVLVWQQLDQTTNGLYNASSGNWTRSIDAKSNDQWACGLQVIVTHGTQYAGTFFECTTPDPITLGTSAIIWVINAAVSSARQVNTTAPIVGGGSLATNLTLSLTINGSLQVTGGALAVAPLSAVAHRWVSSFSAAGVPQLTQPAAADIASGAALTGANDTNVTLTVGGTAASALLAAASITAGWTGTLAANRLNSNVVQGVTNDTNVTGSIAAQNLSFGWTGTLAVARGGTGGGTASGTLLDNISAFSSTGFLTRTGAGTYVFQSATNGISNANLAQGAAATLKGNPTVALANEQDFTVQGLTNLASPSSTLDFLPIYDHVSGTIKNVTPGAIAGSVVAGVAAIDTKTGNFTTGNGVTSTAGNVIQLANANNNTLKGNNSGGSAVPTDLTADQAVTLLKTGVAAAGMLQSKYVTFSYNLATASGSQSITGVGFKPSTLIIVGFVNSTNSVAVGFADAGGAGAAVTWYGSNLGTGGAHPFEMFLANGAGTDFAAGNISSYDSDGFTISWTKSGSPTGTVTWSVLALR